MNTLLSGAYHLLFLRNEPAIFSGGLFLSVGWVGCPPIPSWEWVASDYEFALMCWATREARAIVVSIGLTPDAVGKPLASPM